MGTFAMLLALNRHWRSQSHPVFQIQKRFHPFSLTGYGRALMKRIAAIASVLFFLLTLFIAVGWFLNPSGPASLRPAITALSVIMYILLFLLFLGIFLWPASVAISTSRVIIVEREEQTWDILLTTPIDWREVVLAKEAAALQRLPPYIFVILWSLATALIMLVVMTNAAGPTSPADGLASMLVAFIFMVLLVIVGFQVYLWAGMIGLLASLFTPTRQIAMAAAGLTSFFASLFGVLLIVLVGPMLTTIFIGLLLSSFVGRMGLTGIWVAVVALLNDLLFRGAFRLLMRHLGDSDLPMRRWLRGAGAGD